MFRFSKKMIYAVEAVVYVALHGQTAPVQSRAITGRQQIPERYLEQVLQRLVRCDILKGVRGPRGGYRLARPAERISIGEIVGVIRGLDGGDESNEHESASELGELIVLPIFETLDREVMERLDRVLIADLVKQAQSGNSNSAESTSPARLLQSA
ncbi:MULTISPECIES: Rrf2 family transcriptional regulator [unclassified Iodidimonas]|jgi:Rrf2 family protein|uniref:RrF2 family transcriptional regulator n=1 Tax=unclassified Iodidimonas TaxID=2626145 RepID=UPI002482C3BA|nr:MULTISPECIES: Rrf2 family transcriptional regulator [unclassified Iodidimonas]